MSDLYRQKGLRCAEYIKLGYARLSWSYTLRECYTPWTRAWV